MVKPVLEVQPTSFSTRLKIPRLESLVSRKYLSVVLRNYRRGGNGANQPPSLLGSVALEVDIKMHINISDFPHTEQEKKEALRKECGYAGAQPSWNETLDASSFSTSTILDPIYGFGGNGVGVSRDVLPMGPLPTIRNPLVQGTR